ncbi:MAG: hypothetical protein QOE45_546 [Frankiaceae bacterium]|nr:hypothetical protein [Frankiaceae bacterium]
MKRAGLALVVLVLAGCGGGADDPTAKAAVKPKPQLPGGGRVIFAGPKRRIVAFYGNPRDAQLGTLGIGSPAEAAARLKRVAARYAQPGRPVLPAMELLATVANAAPGDDGLYRSRMPAAMIRRYLRAARAVGAELVLDIQPGHAAFLPEAKHLERWLREPDVSLALDPEWHVAEGELPGQVIGSVDASEVVAVGAWLDALTQRLDLPQKVLVVHQFTEGMIKRRELLRPYRSVAVVLNTDGFGTAVVKAAKYREFAKLSGFAFNGFKLFYEEDTGLMSPRRVLRLRPAPDLVVYE